MFLKTLCSYVLAIVVNFSVRKAMLRLEHTLRSIVLLTCERVVLGPQDVEAALRCQHLSGNSQFGEPELCSNKHTI